MVTIQQIADIVGLSRSAVSCALNNPKNPRVSRMKLKEIQETAERLGYCGNEVARAVKTGRSKNILYAGCLDRNSGPLALSIGLSEILSEHGYNMNFINLVYEKPLLEGAEHLAKRCRAQMADGIVLTNLKKEQIAYLHKKLPDIPMIYAGEFNEQEEISSVEMDHDAAFESVAEFFARLGTRRSMILAYADRPELLKRYSSTAKRAFQKYSLPWNEKNIFPLPFPLPSNIQTQLTARLKQEKPDSILSVAENLALITGYLAEKNAQKIPVLIGKDISDNKQGLCFEQARLIVPCKELGRKAGELLINHLDNSIELPQKELVRPSFKIY